MKQSFKNSLFIFLGVIVLPWALSSCGDDEPIAEENVEEVITNVTLTFSPVGEGSPVVATFVDADGDGVMMPDISDLSLAANTTYEMAVTLFNSIEGEDITEEIEEEDNEHQFFFSFTDGSFSSPTGTGNIGGSGTVNYSDMDENNLPVGLITSWTTGDASSGTFTVVLKHQPDGQKTATSTSSVGETDVEIEWPLNIQ